MTEAESFSTARVLAAVELVRHDASFVRRLEKLRLFRFLLLAVSYMRLEG